MISSFLRRLGSPTRIKTIGMVGASIQGSHRSLSSSTEVPKSSRKYDMVISGGGIVGAALACRIAGTETSAMLDRRIACLEAFLPKSFADVTSTSSVDLRTYAIAPRSAKLLEEIGVWSRIVQSGRCQPFSSMQVWDATGHPDSFINFSAGENLGYIVENSVLQSALYEKMLELKERGRLDVLCPSTVETIQEVDMGGYLVKASTDEHEFYTNLLVAADGGNSKIRKLLGFGSWGWSYEQNAIVATVKLDVEGMLTDDDGEAIDFLTGRVCKTWQRFLPTGPVAILPLWDNMASIVWSTSIEDTKSLKDCTGDEFVSRLNAAFQEECIGSRMPSFLPPNHLTALFGKNGSESFTPAPVITELCSPRFSFPLQLSQASTYAKRGVALIGDAAHTVHPMAGQGLNLGLGDVDVLSGLLDEVNSTGGNFGDMNVLKEYEKERKDANVMMASSLDVLKRIFDSESLPLQAARGLGMSALNSAPIVKEKIAKYAMGL